MIWRWRSPPSKAGMPDRSRLTDGISALSSATTWIQRFVNWRLSQSASAARAGPGHAESRQTAKEMYRREGHGSHRRGSARVQQLRWRRPRLSGTRSLPRIDLPKKSSRSSLSMSLLPRKPASRHHLSRRRPRRTRKPEALAKQFDKLGLANTSSSTARDRRRLHGAARDIPNIDVLPSGHRRLRHPAAQALVLTKAALDALEARFEVAPSDPRHYDVIIAR